MFILKWSNVLKRLLLIYNWFNMCLMPISWMMNKKVYGMVVLKLEYLI